MTIFHLGCTPARPHARTLADAKLGNRDRAKRVYTRLVALYPTWCDNPGAELKKFFPAAMVVDRLAAGLAEVAAEPVN